jgi:release factor glutamine methyltransferase
MDGHARQDTSAVRTWGEARADAARRLRAGADPGTASLDADVLLAFAIGVTKEQLIAHPETALADADAARLDALLGRRAAGEPVAYLRGWKEFYGERFRVDPRVLIPRPETETLVEEARLVIAGRGVLVADIGTGSGAIACSIVLHEPRARVIATDASADALAVASQNARELGVADRIDFRHGDLLAPISEQVDLVCANLPYLRDDQLARLTGERTSLAFEPRDALVAGADGLDVIRRAAADLPRVLAGGGVALFECDPPQAASVARLLTAAGLRTRVVKDLGGSERVVAGAT